MDRFIGEPTEIYDLSDYAMNSMFNYLVHCINNPFYKTKDNHCMIDKGFNARIKLTDNEYDLLFTFYKLYNKYYKD